MLKPWWDYQYALDDMGFKAYAYHDWQYSFDFYNECSVKG